MKDPNLLLRFTLDHNPEVQVRMAARIRLDDGGLIVYDAATGRAERLSLAELNVLSIEGKTQRPADRYIH